VLTSVTQSKNTITPEIKEEDLLQLKECKRAAVMIWICRNLLQAA